METILLVVESEDLQKSLPEVLKNRFEIICCNSTRLRDELMGRNPCALVLDLFLPGTDGFAVLSDIRDCLPSVILMLTPLISPYIAQTAASLGVGFLVRIPCPVSAVAGHLIGMLQKFNDRSRPIFQTHLQRLGIPAKLNGYQQLCIALPLFAQDPNQSLLKELYPTIGHLFGCSPQAVEHAIRTAIRAAWSKRDPDVWAEYFPGLETCPTNKEFIAALSSLPE